jgi:hypothetical protein
MALPKIGFSATSSVSVKLAGFCIWEQVELQRRDGHDERRAALRSDGRGADGIADFNALHSRQHEDEVQLGAYDQVLHDVQASI